MITCKRTWRNSLWLLAAASSFALVQPLLAQPVTGSLETVRGVRVLKLWGTPDQRGYAHGFLLGDDLMDSLEDTMLNERIVDAPQIYESKVHGQLVRRFRFTADQRAELEGMLRGIVKAVGLQGIQLKKLHRDLDVFDLMALNSMADWYPFACSSFSAWGPATKGGEMITARNLDFIPLPGLADHVLIVYLSPGGGRLPWVSLAWPGLIGAYSAMNAEGVTVSMHDATPLQPTHQGAFVPRSLALRAAMETARAGTAIDDVKRVLIKSPAMMGNNIHVSSPYDGQPNPAVVFEYDGNLDKHGGVTPRFSTATPSPCWLTCTNHYCVRTKAPPQQNHPFDSAKRFGTISDAVARVLESAQKINLSKAKEILSSVAQVGSVQTLQTVFYFPNRKELHIGLASPGKAVSSAPLIVFALPELLAK